mmetsp:Transcript_117189/g.164846  ORF Transcript_117189/g.164846 Transcript_117189/m.164846 type:complete len:150 (+) Transcript_117189:23-472(+)
MGAITGKSFGPCCGSRDNHQEYDEKPSNFQPVAQQRWAMSIMANPIVLGQVCKKSFRQYEQNGQIRGSEELKLVSEGVCEQLKIGHLDGKLQYKALAEMNKDSASTFTLEEFQRFFELYLKYYCNTPAEDPENKNNGLMSVYSKRYDSA